MEETEINLTPKIETWRTTTKIESMVLKMLPKEQPDQILYCLPRVVGGKMVPTQRGPEK